MKRILSILLLGLLMFSGSCSRSDDTTKKSRTITNLNLMLQNDGAVINLSFQSREIFQCPSELVLEQFEEHDDRVVIRINPEIYYPATPCFAIYSPQPATTSVQLANEESSKVKDLLILFGQERINGKISLGISPEISLEDNCCLTVQLGQPSE